MKIMYLYSLLVEAVFRLNGTQLFGVIARELGDKLEAKELEATEVFHTTIIELIYIGMSRYFGDKAGALWSLHTKHTVHNLHHLY